MLTTFLIILGVLALLGCGNADDACCILLLIKIIFPLIAFVVLFFLFVVL